MRVHFPFICAFICLLASAQAQIDIIRSTFSPDVIPSNHQGVVRFEVQVASAAQSVEFEYDGERRPMVDDGTKGDRVAGDLIYTITFTRNEIFAKVTPERVYRPVLGFVHFNGNAVRLNVIAQVWTQAVGLAPIKTLSPTAQRTDYVINFTANSAQLLGFPSGAHVITQRLYEHFGDHFDFINFVLVNGRLDNAFHLNASNAVDGIGLSIQNSAASYGSGGRLKGFNVFPIPGVFDGSGSHFNHETAHQWINHLSNTPFKTGALGHWPRGSLATGVMGINLGSGAGGQHPYEYVAQGGGSYRVEAAKPLQLQRFTKMELYLMGLAAPSEVPAYINLVNQNQNVTIGQTLNPAEVTQVSLNQALQVHGPRQPDHNQSQKHFRFATVVLSEDLLTPQAISLYDFFARRIESKSELTSAIGLVSGPSLPFYLATDKRATASSRMTDPQMTLEGGGLAIANGEALPDAAKGSDFGGAQINGGHVSKSFTIRNTGEANLTMSGSAKVRVTGPHSKDFQIVKQPGSPVSPQKSSVFTIRFKPAAAGLRTAVVSIANNAPDASPFTFAVQGMGLKIPAIVRLAGLEQTFKGQPRLPAVLTQPAGLPFNLTVDGGGDAPVNAGTYQVTATVEHDRYQGAASANFVIAKAPQKIVFPPIPDTLASMGRVLTATGGASGTSVYFTVVDGPAEIDDDILLTFTGKGEVTIAAHQDGGPNHLPADPVTRTFQAADVVILFASLRQAPDGSPKPVAVSTQPLGLPVQITYDGATEPPIEAGTYLVEAVIDEDEFQAQASALLVLDPRLRDGAELATAPADINPLDEEKNLLADAWHWETGVQGVYEGLLRQQDGGSGIHGIFEAVKVSRPRRVGVGGILSGRLRINGKSVTLRGAFAEDGTFRREWSFPKDGLLVTAELQVRRTVEDELIALHGLVTCTVGNESEDKYEAWLRRHVAAASGKSGALTLLMPADEKWRADMPVGDGWGRIIINRHGRVKMAAKLGDGTSLVESSFLCDDDGFRLYRHLYRSKPARGFAAGLMKLRDLVGISDADGVIEWEKHPVSGDRRYASGFSFRLPAVGSWYVPPAKGARILAGLVDEENNVSVRLFGFPETGFDEGLAELGCTWSAGNRLSHAGPEFLSGHVERTTGLLSGSHRKAAGLPRIRFNGVAFQKQNRAGGQFLTTEGSGELRITPTSSP